MKYAVATVSAFHEPQLPPDEDRARQKLAVPPGPLRSSAKNLPLEFAHRTLSHVSPLSTRCLVMSPRLAATQVPLPLAKPEAVAEYEAN